MGVQKVIQGPLLHSVFKAFMFHISRYTEIPFTLCRPPLLLLFLSLLHKVL